MLFLHLICCAAMTGIIWIIQLLVYPGFAFVDQNEFLKMHNRHTSKITWVVAPLMGIELVTAAMLAAQHTNAFYIFNLVAVLALWALTGLVSVPIHNQLAKNAKSQEHIYKLTFTNWPRTLIWTIRLILLCVFTGVVV